MKNYKGVCSCLVDYSTDLGTRELDPLKIGKEAILKKIRSLGYLVEEMHILENKKEQKDRRVIVTLFCTLNIVMCATALYAKYFVDDLLIYSHFFAHISSIFSLPL
jgi:hypothetical protein